MTTIEQLFILIEYKLSPQGRVKREVYYLEKAGPHILG